MTQRLIKTAIRRCVAAAILACLAAPCLVASGWASDPEPILDLARLPSLAGQGRDIYTRNFLSGGLNRAFAVSSDGHYGGAWGGPSLDAVRADALKSCADKGGRDCAIYAENLDVVWHGATPRPRAVPGPLAVDGGYAIVPDARFFWRGPDAAAGLIVWGHGYGGPQDDERGRQPFGFLRPLNDAGYDVARFDRDPQWDHDIDRVVGFLRHSLVEFRARGWRRIVAGGQSRGGWNALELMRAPGAADVVVTTSAAAFGEGAGNQAMAGETKFYALGGDIPSQPTRLAFIQFADDPFAREPETRARLIRDRFGPKVAALLLIDRPPGFAGHMAGASSNFGIAFGACIQHFVMDANPPAAC